MEPYEFSFDKRQAVLLVMVAGAIAVLLLGIGFLAGRLSLPSRTSTDTAAVSKPKSSKPEVAKLEATEPKATKSGEAGISGNGGGALPAATSSSPEHAEAAQGVVPGVDPTGAVSVPAAGAPASADPDKGTASATQLPTFSLQFGSFQDAAQAKLVQAQLGDAGIKAVAAVLSDSLGRQFTVLRAGSYADPAAASDAARLEARQLRRSVIVRPANRL